MRTNTTEWQRPWIPKLAACLAVLATGCTTPWGKLGTAEDDGDGESESGDSTTGAGEGESGSDDGGQTSNGQTSGAETSGMETGDEPPEVCELDVGESDRRAMVRSQYENTVADLFGVPADGWSSDALWDALPSDRRAGPFAAMPLDQGEAAVAGAYEALAFAAAQAIDPAALLPCDPATPDPDACTESLITSLGRLAWRRPLEPAEVAALQQEYVGTDLLQGTHGVVEALLASPNLWILHETGSPWSVDAGVTVLDSRSLATRMAYFLWGSTPDASLLDQAEAGVLTDPTVRAAEAERMLADPRAERMLGQLYREWLEIDLDAAPKDDTQFPSYDPSLTAAMERELELFVSDVVLGSDPRIHTLLNAPFSHIDGELQALYGSDVSGTPGVLVPGEFVRVDLDPVHRGGLLTLPAVMTQHSGFDRLPWSPRGLLVRENLLCMTLPPPPPGIDTTPPDDAGARYETWQASVGDHPECMACHQYFDPISFAFDEYDPIGQWQSEIAEEPVQTSGEILLAGGPPVSFSGRAELTQILPTLPEVTQCAVQQHLRFALRRELGERDACAVEDLAEQVEASDGDLRVLLQSVVAGEHFGLVRPR